MEKPEITIGLDLGDRFSHYCMLNGDGDAIESGRIQTTEEALRRHFEGEPTMRFALECGTHSPWISRLVEQMGHQVIVANTRKIRAITGSESKNDKNDAEKLARFAFCDPRLLSPIRHRSPERQQDLNLIHARSTLVRARTMIVNALRGLVKSAGGRLPACSPQGFQERVEASIPLHWPRRHARCCTRSPHSTPASGRWIAASSSWPNGTRRSTLCALFPASDH